ncbi:hypothetical protein ScPMuIL_009387 [Solemya velum]
MASSVPADVCWRVVISLILTGTCLGKFIHFDQDYEYKYKFQSRAELKDLGTFIAKATISYTNVQELAEGQELLLRVYTFQLTNEEHLGVQGHNWDLSNWFSFVITPNGEILRVYHARGDSDEVVAVKKGLAALLAGKLHNEDEVPGERTGRGWTYRTAEYGHEGHHNSTYVVVPTSQGREFHKTRHGHPIPHFKGNYTKIMHYHDELGTIHSVMIEEDYVAPFSTKPGFDPHYGMRKVKAVNEFSDVVYPDMSGLGKGELKFLQRRQIDAVFDKPGGEHIRNTSIHIDKVKPAKPPRSYPQAQTDIQGNLTCMQRHYRKGSPELSECFMNIVNILRSLSDSQVSDLADYYFSKRQPKSHHDTVREAMMDAFGAMQSEHAQELLVTYVLLTPNPSHKLAKRLFIQFVSMDTLPIELFITTLEEICFQPEQFPQRLFIDDTHHRALLTLGSVAKRLAKFGDVQRAHEYMTKIHDMLGIHDPWHYRQRRETMTEGERLQDEHHKVVLLEVLGNARLDMSFEFIVSHINTTNAPWIKRAGVHALRHYHHSQAANALLMSALSDEDANVRYEALLQYQAHPRAAVISPLDARSETNTTAITDPYRSGITDIDLHHRGKRALFDGIKFDLVAPGVDWRKMIGSTTIGASFGVVMENGLHLKIGPLDGAVNINIFDEAYIRIHLGFFGINLEFFLARICFKGGAEYNLNILQEFNPKEIEKKAKSFGNVIKDIISAVKKGIDLFREIINGDIVIQDIIKEFAAALEEMPAKVIMSASAGFTRKGIQYNVAPGLYNEEQLPPFIQPLKQMVDKVTTLFNDIKSDVMGFYNTLVETITIIIPQAMQTIYTAIVDMIDGFDKIGKDPKQAIAAIGKITSHIVDIKTQFTIVLDMSKWPLRRYLWETQMKQMCWMSDAIKRTYWNLSLIWRVLADKFMELYEVVFGLVKDIKDAYNQIKEVSLCFQFTIKASSTSEIPIPVCEVQDRSDIWSQVPQTVPQEGLVWREVDVTARFFSGQVGLRRPRVY